MAHGFDTGVSIKNIIELILKINNLPLMLCTDSKSLYECLVKLGTTQEKHLMINILCLRQAYERRLITKIVWIDGTTNPADAVMKSKPCQGLKDLIDTNKINIKLTGWVERGNDEEKGVPHQGLKNKESPVYVQLYNNIYPFPLSQVVPLSPTDPATDPCQNTERSDQPDRSAQPSHANQTPARWATCKYQTETGITGWDGRSGPHRISQPIEGHPCNPPVRDRTTGGNRDKAVQGGYIGE
jgi:hypothetical protein